MSRGIRSFTLAVGAAALLSAQAAYAVPTASTAPIVAQQQPADPLVSLSLLGGTQSRAALCAAQARCGLPVVMASSAATTTALQPNDGPPPRVNPLLLALGLGLVVLVIVLIATSGNGNSEGNLTPVSPD
jgi:peptidoglycan/LPS O-acetylase OafA/YrhL